MTDKTEEAVNNIERLEAELSQALSQMEVMREALDGALVFLTTAPLESDTCCCGDLIEGHGYHSGHSPVDQLGYYASQLAEQIRAALSPKEPQS